MLKKAATAASKYFHLLLESLRRAESLHIYSDTKPFLGDHVGLETGTKLSISLVHVYVSILPLSLLCRLSALSMDPHRREIWFLRIH